MDIYELREMLERNDITELPLRCATYSRVSTEKETQAASLINMTDDFREFVDRQENWTFVKSYIDDGKSGLTTRKRQDFLKLLAAGAAGEYDLLVTGEISRFGRNTLEGLENIKYLKDKGIPVIFLYDDLNTYDTDCDIQIQQKLVDAENESHKISKRVKRGHAKSIKKGRVLGNRIWGYKKEKCKLTIDPETAPIVQEIFRLYATNQYSMKEIEEILYEKGYRNSRGNRLSHTTMANIIQNPKYKGFYAGGKVKIIDLYTKKQKFLPEEDWVLYRDETGEVVPPLVSEEVWEKANEVFRRRSIDVKGRRNCSTHKNTYTGKLYCAADGAPYYCKDVHYKGTDVSKWVCSHKIKNHADSCPSIAIYEDELNEIVLEVFSEFAENADTILNAYLELYRKAMSDAAGNEAERSRIEKELAASQRKQEDLFEMKSDGIITLDEFRRLMEKTRTQAEHLQQELDNLRHKENHAAELENQLSRLRSALAKGLKSLSNGIITRDFVENYIDRIDITPLGDQRFDLEIRIVTDEIVRREFERVEGRTGHTFKKMIESYEKNLSNQQ